MKKITLFLVFLIISLTGFSQEFNKIISATKLEFQDGKWVTVSTQYPSDAFVIIKNWDVTIGTYKLKTYGDADKTIFETHITYTWRCVNGEGEKCFFMMKKFKPEITSHIVYSLVYDSGVMYDYETEE